MSEFLTNGGNIMIDMEQIARRVVACEGWRWMRGMLCLTDEDGYAARILHVGLTDRQSETADSYDGGGIITRGCIREGSLPDLTDPATLGCLLALVRDAHRDAFMAAGNDGSDWVVRDCDGYEVCRGTSERAVLVAALEVAA